MANFELLKNMKKLGIVINGRGGVGKDTLCDFEDMIAQCFKRRKKPAEDQIESVMRHAD